MSLQVFREDTGLVGKTYITISYIQLSTGYVLHILTISVRTLKSDCIHIKEVQRFHFADLVL